MSDQLTLPAPASEGGLIAAIAAVMTDVHSVAKDGMNKFHGYSYPTMGNVLREITPLLGKHGIVVFQTETGRAMFDGENVIAVEYAFTVVHASGERWPEPIKQTGVSRCRDSKGGWDDKSLAKCHTAARKYFLLSLFQIPTGEEADADAGGNDGWKDWQPVEAPARRVVDSARRAVSAPPRTVMPSPKSRLRQDRTIDRRFEEAFRNQDRLSRPKPSKPVLVHGAPVFTEANPPPPDDIPDGRWR